MHEITHMFGSSRPADHEKMASRRLARTALANSFPASLCAGSSADQIRHSCMALLHVACDSVSAISALTSLLVLARSSCGLSTSWHLIVEQFLIAPVSEGDENDLAAEFRGKQRKSIGRPGDQLLRGQARRALHGRGAIRARRATRHCCVTMPRRCHRQVERSCHVPVVAKSLLSLGA